MLSWQNFEEVERELWKHFESEYGNSRMQPGSHRDALTLSHVLDMAYTRGCGDDWGCVVTDSDVVQYLAGYVRDTMKYGPQVGGVVGNDSETNHFLRHSYKGLVQTMRRAVLDDKVRFTKADEYCPDHYLFGSLRLPIWFVNLYKQELSEQQAHEAKMRDLYGPYLIEASDNE